MILPLSLSKPQQTCSQSLLREQTFHLYRDSPLGKRQHTFSTIFFQPSASSHPGEVPWTEFLSAMNTIGFSPEKVYGSVWCFTPREGGVIKPKQPINFHEPHPEGKLRFEVARNYGRRLTRNYGINGSSFIVA